MKQLGQIKKGDPQKRTFAELIANAQIKKAMKGNTVAAKEICELAPSRLVTLGASVRVWGWARGTGGGAAYRSTEVYGFDGFSIAGIVTLPSGLRFIARAKK